MKFVFFGTPEFAAIILEKLIENGFVPAAVVCNPDRPVGRKKIITPPPVKERVMSQGSGVKDRIKILQPEKLDEEFHNSLFMLHDSHPDLFIVAAYAQILPKKLLEIPRLGVIGVHPSLLPKHRGASPIQSAILDGDEKTGVTLYLLDDKMDHGKIVSSIKCQVSGSDTYKTLERKLAGLGGDLLVQTLPKYLSGEIAPMAQSEAGATYTKKFERRDAFIEAENLRVAEDGTNFEKAVEIERKIRAFNPEPGAWTILNGKQVKLLESELIEGKLKLKKIQTEGEKPKALFTSSHDTRE